MLPNVKDNAQAMTTLTAKYAVRAADAKRDREAILALWRQAFPFPMKHSIKYDWCYVPTPQGDGRLYVMEYGDDATVIGVQGIVPRCWWHQGKAIHTGICADLVVDINHRSIGPALTMVRSMVEIEQNQAKAALLYAFPNPKTEALYRRAGYQKMGEITRYARPLRLRVWLQRKGLPSLIAKVVGALADLVLQTRVVLSTLGVSRQWRYASVTEFDARFDELWSRVAKNAGPMVMRNSEYLRWRFSNNFAGQTRVMVLEAQDGRIDGYVVYLIDADKMVTIMDFLAVDNQTVLSKMLNLCIRQMYKQGYCGITLEFAGPQVVAHMLRQVAFSPRNTNPIYAVFSDTTSGLPQGILPYFTACDRDQ